MKSKKIFTAIGAVAMATIFALSAFSGCKKKEEHAYTWTIDKEATCTTEGKKTGVCGICGDVQEVIIPVDKNAHVYGDWQISQPTEEATGSASRECALNSAHKVDVTLPKITKEGTGYLSSEITKQPTVISEGERTFVFEHSSGNVTFIQTLPLKQMETVEDAVILGSSRGDLIRKESGRYTEALNDPEGTRYSSFLAEYNNDHTVITDKADNLKQYFSYDEDGKVFGIEIKMDSNGQATGDPKVMENVVEACMLGYGYASGGGNGLRTYGAEQTLYWYYQKGKDAREDKKAVKYSEDIDIYPNGSVDATFQFSYYENPTFCRYTIEFSLGANGVIESLVLTTEIVREWLIAEDENGQKMFDKDGDVIFAVDDETGIQYSYEHEYMVVRVLEYDAPVLKTENDVVPDNPFNSNIRYITSFDVTYNGEVLSGDNLPLFPSVKSFNLNVTNVQPAATADLDYDPLTLYVRTNNKDMALTLNTSDNPYNIMGFFNKESKQITLRAEYAGKLTLVIKTKGGLVEKVFNMEFDTSAPSTLLAQAYVYSDADGEVSYNWTDCDSNQNNAVTIYVGQPLKIRSNAPAGELAYADLSFTAEITNAVNKLYMTFTEEYFEGRNIYSAVASRVGTYQIWLRYVKNRNVYTSIYVKVVAAPQLSTLINGEYTGNLADIRIGSAGKPSPVTVLIEPGENYLVGKVYISVGDEMESHFNYVFNEETKEFILEYYYGVSVDVNYTFDFSLKINEAYKLVLTHSMTFGGGAEKESVVLKQLQT